MEFYKLNTNTLNKNTIIISASLIIPESYKKVIRIPKDTEKNNKLSRGHVCVYK